MWELEWSPLLDEPSQHTYTSQSGACSIDLSAPHSNSNRNAGNTNWSPLRVGQRDKSSTVPVMPPGPPGQPELEPELPLEDDDDDELLLLGSPDEDEDELLLELLELEEDEELLDDELELDELLDDDDDELELEELLLEDDELGAQHPSPNTNTSHWQLSA